MKVALGMIVKSIDSEVELMNFIENASKYGQKLDCVIAAYTHNLDPRVEQIISNHLPFYTVDIKKPHYCIEQMRHRGIPDDAARTLYECPVDLERGMVPYGFNRMFVVMEAILRGIDTLCFVDSDVYPYVLKRTPKGTVSEEIDFFGAHLKHLNTGADVTTGEYSGYNILPPAKFDGMEDLLDGVQKSSMREYWQKSETHRSLVFQPDSTEAKPCNKVLGGNTAIKLSSFAKLPPFFSSHYILDDEMFLCRGEDTTLGLAIEKTGITCMDIGLHPLHDTYKDYPTEPDLQNNPGVQERFYYACTGWVGRNPFFNYMLGNDLQSTKEKQRISLERGLHALSKYTSNPKFKNVLRNFDVSWDNADRYINEFERTCEAWNAFIERTELG